MNINLLMNQISQLKEIEKEMKNVFLLAIVDICKKYEVESLGWNHESDYYNDETTVDFRVSSDAESMKVNDEYGWDLDESDPKWAALEELSILVESLPRETLLREWFGASQEVTIFHDGTWAKEEYAC